MSVKTQQVVNGELVEVPREEIEGDEAVDQETEVEETEVEETEVDETEEAEEVEEKPLWLEEEAEIEEEAFDSVPVATHIDLKKKLKGTIKDQNEEMEQLKRENAQLKQQSSIPVEKPKRPRPDDFGTTAEFDMAMDNYEQEVIQFQAKVVQQTAAQQQKVEAFKQKIEVGVDSHYTRAETLVKQAKLEPEVFQQAEVQVKQAVEKLMPNKGEYVFNHMVSMVGEGSEKIALYLGRNKKALQGFTDALKDDPSGLNAMLYIGRLTERINGNVSKTSRAPKPAKKLKSGEQPVKASAALKKYNAAHKDGKPGEAYKLKQKAKADGVDVSNW